MATGKPTYTAWQNNTNPNWWQDAGLRFNVLCCVMLYLGTYTTGYDTAYFGSVVALPAWGSYFAPMTSSKLGLAGASSYLQVFISFFMSAWLVDKIGRRWPIIMGSLVIVIGAIVGALAQNYGMLVGGRVIVGFGNQFKNLGSICLLNEITHPRLRGMCTAGYLTCYYVGSTIAAWVGYAAVGYSGNSGWRLVTGLQALGPALLAISVFTFIPESPRWLVQNGKREKAHQILARMHANGKADDELVMNEMSEIDGLIDLTQRQGGMSWKQCFATPGNRRRMLVIAIVALGTQWAGNGILVFLISPVLKAVGIKDTLAITGINGGLATFNLVLAIVGVTLVNKLGRRKLWLISTSGMLVCYAIITGLAAGFAQSGNQAFGRAFVAFFYIYYGFYDIAWTPLSYAYTSEILPYQMRARGMAWYTMVLGIGLVFNQYVNPVAFAAMSWRYYGIYVGVLAVLLVLVYFLFIESRGYTSEEAGLLFDHIKDRRAVLDELHADVRHRSEPHHDENDKVDKIEIE